MATRRKTAPPTTSPGMSQEDIVRVASVVAALLQGGGGATTVEGASAPPATRTTPPDSASPPAKGWSLREAGAPVEAVMAEAQAEMAADQPDPRVLELETKLQQAHDALARITLAINTQEVAFVLLILDPVRQQPSFYTTLDANLAVATLLSFYEQEIPGAAEFAREIVQRWQVAQEQPPQ